MIYRPASCIIVACILSVVPLSNAKAQDTRDGIARAQIVQSLSAQAINDLRFGTITVSELEGGEVIVAPLPGAVRYTGGVRGECRSAGECSVSPARFDVRGEPLRRYTIAIDAEVEAIGERTGQILRVERLRTDKNPTNPAPLTSALDEFGKDLLTIGGTLVVPAGTASDVFRAELPITLAYE